MKKTTDAPLGMHILEVEITTRCNLNCKHCYNRKFEPIDLPIDTFKQLFNFATENNVWTFTISGGEAFMHPNFQEILDFIQSKPHKFRLVLQSNGTLFQNPENQKKISAFDLVHLSCDSVSDVRLFGEKNFITAKALMDQGIDCYLFATIHKKNKDSILSLVKKAKSIGVPIGFNICIQTENLPASFLLNKEEFMETEKLLNSLYEAGDILRYSSPLIALLDPAKQQTFNGIHGGCSAGIAACVVDPKGEVYPCPFFRKSAGNIYKNNLYSIWLESPLFKTLRARLQYDEPCKSCKSLSHCGGCRNRSYNNTGSLTACDPLCYKDLL
ncbi:MAG: radical SAM protein [Patescibacteria group bacterium]|nr:radical SAM protein [Patescibacteria group bacterium]